jgi:hypothetical protein
LEGKIKKLIGLVVVAVIAVGFLGFTLPGHRVLNSLGFAAADGTSGGCGGSGC